MMGNLIEFKNLIIDYEVEVLLNKLVSESKEYESLRGKREDLRDLSEKKIFLLKMELLERFYSKQ